MKRICSSFFSITGTFLLVTTLCAGALIFLAVYNVIRWQGNEIPNNSVSRLIVFSQLVLVLLLFGISIVQFLAMLVQLSVGKWKNAALCLAGAAISLFAILFTMFFDRGSIFFQ